MGAQHRLRQPIPLEPKGIRALVAQVQRQAVAPVIAWGIQFGCGVLRADARLLREMAQAQQRLGLERRVVVPAAVEPV
ncbi:hypothetical protein [Cyanobium sp. Morenito 9A2]|uniref:hypothetical protein n=1 Tax=Cyanobium sp. Morenito 9A2 TaxID=2823718 RepID=UPI0020CD0644|nr:hypothetical protein [Cyanobium sp. Morenito 9A2]MCP9848480.1 hypothetical protein [Cyanobium sp. Morenito 9A2]